MIEKVIEQLTNEGDLVVDPCAGSFTTLKACLRTNRKFLGCDLTLRALMRFNINKERSRELLKKEGKINNI
jgi:DNA modification methylase